MRLTVNHKRCLKSGQCTYMHPDIFKEGPDGYPLVLVPEPQGEQRLSADDAIELCPASAIGWEEAPPLDPRAVR